jgi:hypothetical protein
VTVEDLRSLGTVRGVGTGSTATAALERRMEKVNLNHVKPLFATKKLAWSTSLIMAIWGFIGLAYPLYNAFIPYLVRHVFRHRAGADFALAINQGS